MKKVEKQRLFIAAGILILTVTGCGRKTQENHDILQQTEVREEHLEREQPKENLDYDAEYIAALYRDIYNQAADSGKQFCHQLIHLVHQLDLSIRH